jgi:hypothetical protein
MLTMPEASGSRAEERHAVDVPIARGGPLAALRCIVVLSDLALSDAGAIPQMAPRSA